MDKGLKHRINAGRVAIKNQLEFFYAQFANVESEYKADDTRVTFADYVISEKIFSELCGQFPTDDFCSEEFNPEDAMKSLNAKYAWVLDPIDGTNNYAIGIPVCAISLALLRDGIPVYGFVYDMPRKRMIEGGPGFGVTDEGQKACLKSEPMNMQSVIGLHFPVQDRHHQVLAPMFLRYRIRSMGSAALNLAYTAIGILDGCVDIKVKVWDIAAGYAFIKALGGKFRFLEGNVFPLREFHVNQPIIPYYAGTDSFCELMDAMFLHVE